MRPDEDRHEVALIRECIADGSKDRLTAGMDHEPSRGSLREPDPCTQARPGPGAEGIEVIDALGEYEGARMGMGDPVLDGPGEAGAERLDSALVDQSQGGRIEGPQGGEVGWRKIASGLDGLNANLGVAGEVMHGDGLSATDERRCMRSCESSHGGTQLQPSRLCIQ